MMTTYTVVPTFTCDFWKTLTSKQNILYAKRALFVRYYHYAVTREIPITLCTIPIYIYIVYYMHRHYIPYAVECARLHNDGGVYACANHLPPSLPPFTPKRFASRRRRFMAIIIIICICTGAATA